DLLLEGPVELVLAGDPTDPALAALARAAGRRYLPNRVIAHALPGEAERPAASALLEGRPGTGPATAYVCREAVCQAPSRDARALAAALDEAERVQRVSRAATLAAQPLAGRATAEGTARYLARRVPGGAPRRLGRDGPWVSALGFGAYRVVEQSGEHRAALAAALAAGVNLVDTSTNYGGGSSETLVGQVLGELVASGAVARDEVVVVSKVGYLEGATLEEARSRAAAGDSWPEVVRFDEQAWHCIHPAFLEAELTRSLARLGLETLDVCLLHNPEHFLLEAARQGAGALDVARTAFYASVEAAFRHLEREVARGRIAAYGLSSNTLAAAATDPGATDVARLHAAALRAGGERHSFRLVELPL
ncbi:MAG TPA: aldo/keto reductase, partial [Polyangiaceae bacterium]|nr:aldo/keto reductase [Polyangiaceae bacterium]